MKKNLSLIAIFFVFITCSCYAQTQVSESSAMSYFDANKNQLDFIEGVWISQQYLVKYVDKQHVGTEEIEGKAKRIIIKENGVYKSYTPNGESNVYFTKTDQAGLYLRNIIGDDAQMDEAYVTDDASLEVTTLIPEDMDVASLSGRSTEEVGDLSKIQIRFPANRTELYRVIKYIKVYPAE